MQGFIDGTCPTEEVRQLGCEGSRRDRYPRPLVHCWPGFFGKVLVDDYADSSVPSVFWFPADIAAFSAGFAELPEGKESKVLDGLSEFLDDVSVS
jgi:hypothetical protein